MTGSGEENHETRRRRDLAEFLKAKRAALKPGDFGIPDMGRRRTPGLRREELAQIAGIGITWYTWLEQGRPIHVSPDFLQRLTRVLRLSPHDAVYLASLAGQPVTPLPRERGLIEGLQTVLDGYILGPALASDATGNILAYNQIGDFVYRFSDNPGPRRDNMFWRLFMDPYRRQMYVDWQDFARYSVGLMRGLYASRKDDLAFREMIGDLCRSCPVFHTMWDESSRQGASSYAPNRVHLRVPGLGHLDFLSVPLQLLSQDWIIFWSPLDEKTASAMTDLAPLKRE
jgi:transcriptional regulator with XRE-family HTH domain